MPASNSEWYLKKHADAEVFGPIQLRQLVDWADAAQINALDSISNDGINWLKAPMVAELQMDWLVDIPGQPLYGPTTAGALLEFLRSGEISPATVVINSCNTSSMPVSEAPFFKSLSDAIHADSDDDGLSSKSKIIELETELLKKTHELDLARIKISSLEAKLQALESKTQRIS